MCGEDLIGREISINGVFILIKEIANDIEFVASVRNTEFGGLNEVVMADFDQKLGLAQVNGSREISQVTGSTGDLSALDFHEHLSRAYFFEDPAGF